MAKTFRVVECSSNATLEIAARTPEEAAYAALGQRLVRSGHVSMLRAKVYHDGIEACSMVRLYEITPGTRKTKKPLVGTAPRQP